MNLIEVIFMMLPAFVMCLVLVGIHSYLGIHVIKRKVIFIDLALAQIAALGTLVAFLFGIMPGTLGAYSFSLGLAMIAAAVFALTRFRDSKIPQEAIIGLVYAIAAAAAILMIDKAPHGAEHLKEIMTGHLLWIKWNAVVTAAIVYSAVGLVHFMFHDKFIMISEKPRTAWEKGVNVRLWDFIFYFTFGVVITLSVSSAGVLIVFVFLIAPAILAMVIGGSWRVQIILGWVLGTVVTVSGLVLSFLLDLPTGPAIIGTYGLVMVVVSGFLYVKRHDRITLAVRNVCLTVAAFAAAFALIVVGGLAIGSKTGKGSHAGHGHHNIVEPVDTAQHAKNDVTIKKLLAMDFETLSSEIGNIENASVLRKLFSSASDADAKCAVIMRMLEVVPREAAEAALDYLSGKAPVILKMEIAGKLSELMHEDCGYDTGKPHDCDGNIRAASRIRAHFSQF